MKLGCWIPLCDQIDSLRELRDGWFNGNGRRPEMNALDRVSSFLGLATIHCPVPYLYPTCEGGVRAEWDGRSGEIVVEFPPDPRTVDLVDHVHGDDRSWPLTLDNAQSFGEEVSRRLMSGSVRAVNMSRPSVEPGYESLANILDEALEHAQNGKGSERHSSGEPFDEQPIVAISKLLGSSHGNLFQAIKKLHESQRLPPHMARAERLGAINYIAASILVDESEE